MASLQPVPPDSPTVWLPEDFGEPSSWSFELSKEDQDALTSYARGGSVLDLEARLGSRASHWSKVLTNGIGFLRLRGFPVEDLSEEQITNAYLGLGSLLGRPICQGREGSLITHIRDERQPAGPGVRRFQTNQKQGVHSDASDIVGLLCLKPARSGGTSRVVSAHAVYNEMLRRDHQLVALLFQPMPWSRHTERKTGEVPYFELAPVKMDRSGPRISVIPWFIRQSQEHPEAPRLSDAQFRALDLVEEVMNDHQLQLTMTFASGDIQFLNNTTVLHARDGYQDYEDPAMRRHLLRLWLEATMPVADVVLHGGEEGSRSAQFM